MHTSFLYPDNYYGKDNTVELKVSVKENLKFRKGFELYYWDKQI